MVSIVTASYNYENYIKETIKSVIDQTYKDWEMIIVDDGSIDNSVAVINYFVKKDKRIKLYQHKYGCNKGLAATLQLGIEKAQGNWIVFLESDDLIYPNYLSEKINIIKQYPNIKYIFNDVETFGDAELNQNNTGNDYFIKRKQMMKFIEFPDNIAKEFSIMNIIPTFSCVMCKKSILEKVSFNSPIPQFLDTWLWSQILGKYDVFYIDKKLTKFRLHKDSYNNSFVNSKKQKLFLAKTMYNLYGYKGALFYAIKNNVLRAYISSLIKVFLKHKSKNFIKDEKLISVILPVYNCEETIKKCLRSLTRQTYQHLEIICVYLKSDDNTLDIIQSFHDARVKIVHQVAKTGVGGARNLGLEHATGEYIGFIEADDYIDADFYNQLYQISEKNKSDISVAEIVEPRDDGSLLYLTKLKDKKNCKSFNDKFKIMSNGAVFNKLFKSKLVKNYNLKFTEKYRFEDNPFLMKALYYANCVSLTNRVRYYYCCHGETWESSYLDILKKSIPPIVDEMLNFTNVKHFSEYQKNIIKEIIIESFVQNFLRSKSIYVFLIKKFGKNFFIKRKNKYKKYGLIIR